MNDGAMQSYALTVDGFLVRLSKMPTAATGKVDKLHLRSQYGQP